MEIASRRLEVMALVRMSSEHSGHNNFHHDRIMSYIMYDQQPLRSYDQHIIMHDQQRIIA